MPSKQYVNELANNGQKFIECNYTKIKLCFNKVFTDRDLCAKLDLNNWPVGKKKDRSDETMKTLIYLFKKLYQTYAKCNDINLHCLYCDAIDKYIFLVKLAYSACYDIKTLELLRNLLAKLSCIRKLSICKCKIHKKYYGFDKYNKKNKINKHRENKPIKNNKIIENDKICQIDKTEKNNCNQITQNNTKPLNQNDNNQTIDNDQDKTINNNRASAYNAEAKDQLKKNNNNIYKGININDFDLDESLASKDIESIFEKIEANLKLNEKLSTTKQNKPDEYETRSKIENKDSDFCKHLDCESFDKFDRHCNINDLSDSYIVNVDTCTDTDTNTSFTSMIPLIKEIIDKLNEVEQSCKIDILDIDKCDIDTLQCKPTFRSAPSNGIICFCLQCKKVINGTDSDINSNNGFPIVCCECHISTLNKYLN